MSQRDSRASSRTTPRSRRRTAKSDRLCGPLRRSGIFFKMNARKPIAAVFVGLLAAACGSDPQSPEIQVSGPISCREATGAGLSHLAFCVEQWGLTIAAARTQRARCETELTDAGATGFFTDAEGPCPLDGAFGGCVEARAAPVIVIKWWYRDDLSSPSTIDCHGNPSISPPH